jgi:hypothetical protein
VLQFILLIHYTGKMAYHLEKRATIVSCILSWISLGNIVMRVWKVKAVIMKMDTTDSETGERETLPGNGTRNLACFVY